jgi:hypothetical protein
MRLLSSPFGRKQAAPQPSGAMRKVRLRTGMGDTVTVGGVLFTAEDGVLTVPEDVAKELEASHLPAEGPLLPADVAAIAARIAELRGQRDEAGSRIAEIQAAMALADQRFGVSDAPIPHPEKSLGAALADWLMGTGKRTDVESLRKQAADAEALQRSQNKAREEAHEARAELQARINVIERESVAPLDAEIRRLATWALRVHAEAAARRLRDAADFYAKTFAEVQVHETMLRATEHRFGGYSGGVIELPVFLELEAFQGINGPGGGFITIMVGDLQKEAALRIRASLAEAGIPILIDRGSTMTQLVRMIAPSRTSGHNPFTYRPANASTGDPGLVFDVAAYAAVDVEAAQAGLLETNGFLLLGAIGSTAQRPVPGEPQAGSTIRARHGMRYIDTDLAKVVTYDARQGAWLDYTGTAV